MLINDDVENRDVPNPYAGMPSVSTRDVVIVSRVDKSIGSERIAEYIVSAYDTIADELNATATQKIIADTSAQRKYKRAVIHEAAAILSDLYTDFDTTNAGIARGESLDLKSDKLRRIVRHAIASIKGQSRNRVSLL